MFNTIIFDLGNVLLKFEPERYLMETFSDQALCQELMRTVFKSQEWIELDEGTISDEKALQVFIERSPLIEEEVQLVMQTWTQALTPIVAHVEILEALKAAGYKLYILSNFHKNAYEEQKSKHSFFRHFDGAVISSYVHQLKPSSSIFQTLMDTYYLEPHTCLFLDDVKLNVDMAEQLGIKAIQVTAACDLKSEIEKILGPII